ncbi:hypothetical protein BD560DRAFT_391267, partial [Blakeslea trispora]
MWYLIILFACFYFLNANLQYLERLCSNIPFSLSQRTEGQTLEDSKKKICRHFGIASTFFLVKIFH